MQDNPAVSTSSVGSRAATRCGVVARRHGLVARHSRSGSSAAAATGRSRHTASAQICASASSTPSPVARRRGARRRVPSGSARRAAPGSLHARAAGTGCAQHAAQIRWKNRLEVSRLSSRNTPDRNGRNGQLNPPADTPSRESGTVVCSRHADPARRQQHVPCAQRGERARSLGLAPGRRMSAAHPAGGSGQRTGSGVGGVQQQSGRERAQLQVAQRMRRGPADRRC